MNETILVALDGSPLAEAVLPQAVALATATGRDLLLLGVLAELTALTGLAWPQMGLVRYLPDQQIARTVYQEYLTAVAARLAATGVTVHTRLRQGDPAGEIVAQVAEQPAISTVALATHGRSGLERRVLGSVAERVLHAATVPLLLVRGGIAPPPAREAVAYQHILVPLDGSSFATEALATATTLARRTGATLLLLSVLPPLQDLSFAEAGILPYWMEEARIVASDAVTLALTATAQQLESSGLAVRTLLRHGSPVAEIVRCATDEAADLIVLATHGRSGISQLWLGSIALGVVRSAGQPVLAVRPVGAVTHILPTAEYAGAVR